MGKQVFDYFSSLKFPVGKKKELFIPEIIWLDKNYSVACLRGIFNTDGSIYKRYSKKYTGHSRIYDHFVIQFKMNSEKTIQQVKEILHRLEIKTTKISKSENSYLVRITNQKGIGDFMRVVCPNRYHVERYLNTPKRSSSYGPKA